MVPPLREIEDPPAVVISVPPQVLAGPEDVVVNPAGNGMLNVSPVAGTKPVLSNLKIKLLVRPCTIDVGLKTAVMVGIGAGVTVNDGLAATALPNDVVKAVPVGVNAPASNAVVLTVIVQLAPAATEPPERVNPAGLGLRPMPHVVATPVVTKPTGVV